MRLILVFFGELISSRSYLPLCLAAKTLLNLELCRSEAYLFFQSSNIC